MNFPYEVNTNSFVVRLNMRSLCLFILLVMYALFLLCGLHAPSAAVEVEGGLSDYFFPSS